MGLENYVLSLLFLPDTIFFDIKNKSQVAIMSSEIRTQVLVAKPCHGTEVTPV